VTAIRVVLADDHETVRQGLRLLIEGEEDMEVVDEAADGSQALAQVAKRTPDVVVLDVSMPNMNGLEAARRIREIAPATAVVALTRHADDAYVQALLAAGASGYVLKQSAPRELLDAIRAAARGGRHLDASLTDAAERLRPRHGRFDQAGATITERETEVLRRMALGHSNKDIANELDIAVKTVETHKANAMRKLGLRGRIDVIKYAVLQGWLTEP
jgi:DNA-binding NarL/FixJ family response regulator